VLVSHWKDGALLARTGVCPLVAWPGNVRRRTAGPSRRPNAGPAHESVPARYTGRRWLRFAQLPAFPRSELGKLKFRREGAEIRFD
jgi:hypothetical protein